MLKPNYYKKILLLLACIITASQTSYAEMSSNEKNQEKEATRPKEEQRHYIIAFDRSLGGKYDYEYSVILPKIDNALRDNGIDYNLDYVSMVAYRMDMSNPSIVEFVQPYTKKSHPFIWQQLEGKTLQESIPWPSSEPALRFSWFPASLQSMVKPYIAMETNPNGEYKEDLRPLKKTIIVKSTSRKYHVQRYCANRTILLIVSDGIINGVDNDYFKEWNIVSTAFGANTTEFKKITQEVFNDMTNFNENFKFKSEKEYVVSGDGRYKISTYEVLPTERPSIHSATNLPNPLPLKRVKGGYRLNIKVQPTNSRYQIREIKISGKKDGMEYYRTYDGNMDCKIPSSKIQNGDSIHVDMSLVLMDGYYNGSLLSSEDERYSEGLTETQVVQDEMKILGIVPLTDALWWWFYNDALSAVITWDLFLLLILIAIIGFILFLCFVRINSYTPGNDKLEITKQ
jgi:hypothetical protein